MPALSYAAITDYPFQPFTKIYSADINAMFAAVQTLLNTTKLDDTNLQDAGITRATKLKAGTANYVLINDSNGKVSEEAQLAITRGGTGLNITIGSQSPGDVIQVNAAGNALTVGPPTGVPAMLRVYNFYQFS